MLESLIPVPPEVAATARVGAEAFQRMTAAALADIERKKAAR